MTAPQRRRAGSATVRKLPMAVIRSSQSSRGEPSAPTRRTPTAERTANVTNSLRGEVRRAAKRHPGERLDDAHRGDVLLSFVSDQREEWMEHTASWSRSGGTPEVQSTVSVHPRRTRRQSPHHRGERLARRAARSDVERRCRPESGTRRGRATGRSAGRASHRSTSWATKVTLSARSPSRPRTSSSARGEMSSTVTSVNPVASRPSTSDEAPDPMSTIAADDPRPRASINRNEVAGARSYQLTSVVDLGHVIRVPNARQPPRTQLPLIGTQSASGQGRRWCRRRSSVPMNDGIHVSVSSPEGRLGSAGFGRGPAGVLVAGAVSAGGGQVVCVVTGVGAGVQPGPCRCPLCCLSVAALSMRLW